MQENLTVGFADCSKQLEKGKFIVIPKGIKHKPVVEGEVQVLLFEPKSRLNTGNVINESTVTKLKTLDD